ncbi:MAG: SPOR domain-containing protein [Chlorobi bacterium]|nr:SPOR domain-containing protein [Chlorobiota bacterium]
MTEEAFTEWKNQTRQEALEKEVQRLRERTYRQSGKIASLRRTVYFTTFFFTALLTIMAVKGMIVLSADKTKPTTEQLSQKITAIQKPEQVTTPTENKAETIIDSIPVPLNKTKGLIYCVQIGAYTGINLDDYKENLISLQQDSYDGINQLTLGRFRDYEKARTFLDIVKRIGFNDAFIMKFNDGKRVPVKTPATQQVIGPTPQEPVTKEITDSLTLPEDSVTIEIAISDSLF